MPATFLGSGRAALRLNFAVAGFRILRHKQLMPDATLAGLGILVVEDEPLLRKQIAAHLERLGADVTAAATLQAATAMLAQSGFDFALLDVNLPDGLGTELLQKKCFSPNTGVVVMTANGGVAGAVEAMWLGAME